MDIFEFSEVSRPLGCEFKSGYLMKFNVDIPKGFIWVMGDHRGASADSRFHPESANNGMIPLSKVVGRATFIVWPFTNAAFIPKGEDLKKVPVQEKP